MTDRRIHTLTSTARGLAVAAVFAVAAAACGGSDAEPAEPTDGGSDADISTTTLAAVETSEPNPEDSTGSEAESPADATTPPDTTPSAAPTNDSFEGATVIDPAALPFVDELDTSDATPDPDALPECAEFVPIDAAVWYTFTPTTDSRVLLSGFGSEYSWEIAVVTGEPGSFEWVGCRPFTREIDFPAGVAHHIIVFDNQEDGEGNGGPMRLTVDVLEDAPPNDVIAAAEAIDPAALPFTDTVDTTGAGTRIEDFEIGCPAPEENATVYYSFTPDRDMRIRLTTEGTDYSVGVGVGVIDGIGECRPEEMEYDVEAGTTYLLNTFDSQDDGGGNGGTLELRVDEVVG